MKPPRPGLLCLLLSAVLLQAHLHGQERDVEPGQEAQLAYVIADVQYAVEGRTRVWALQDRLDLERGMGFTSRQQLEQFLDDQAQTLINQRVLQRARIEYTDIEPANGDRSPSEDAEAAGEPAEREQALEPGTRTDAPTRISVTVYVEDTWNLIVLPYFKYDSNTGLLVSLRGRDYNFLGTMEELAVNLDYEFTEEQENRWGVETDLALPFRLWAHDWTWTFSQSLQVEQNNEVEFDLDTGFAYEFSWLLDWTLAYEQSYDYVFEGEQFHTSGLRLSTEIDTGLELPEIGMISWTPEAFARVSYQPVRRFQPEELGPALGVNQRVGSEDVDWVGNFREGAGVSLVNENEYRLADGGWKRSIETSVYGYKPLPPFAVSGRLKGLAELDEVDDEAAEPIRGVLNDNMDADYAAYLNSDLTLRVFRIPSFLEGHGSIFYDLALTREYGKPFDSREDFKQGVGLEAIGFPLFARSLFIRVSVGIDLGEVVRTGSLSDPEHREIFIGLGHHY
jgi:hypothetical protein